MHSVHKWLSAPLKDVNMRINLGLLNFWTVHLLVFQNRLQHLYNWTLLRPQMKRCCGYYSGLSNRKSYCQALKMSSELLRIYLKL